MGEGDFVAALQLVHMLYGTPRFSISAPTALTGKSSNLATTHAVIYMHIVTYHSTINTKPPDCDVVHLVDHVLQCTQGFVLGS